MTLTTRLAGRLVHLDRVPTHVTPTSHVWAGGFADTHRRLIAADSDAGLAALLFDLPRLHHGGWGAGAAIGHLDPAA